MAEVRIDFAVDTKDGSAKIGDLSGRLKELGTQSETTRSILQGVGQAAGQFLVAGLAAAAAAFASVGRAALGAVKGLIDLGGNLSDLSAKTGISTEALQKLAYAGSLVGVSQDEITAAAVKMERSLAAGDAVFGKLGLSVQKLRAMKPDEAFAAIAERIASIKDPAAQALAATEAFGKGGIAVMALLKSNIKEAGDEVARLGAVISDDTIAAADALGDEATKLEKAWEGVKNQFAAAIVQNPQLLDMLKKVVAAMGDLSKWVHENRGAISVLVESGFKVATMAAEALWAVMKRLGGVYMWMAEVVAPGFKKALQDANEAAITAEAVRLAKQALAPKKPSTVPDDFPAGNAGPAAYWAAELKGLEKHNAEVRKRLDARAEVERMEAEKRARIEKIFADTVNAIYREEEREAEEHAAAIKAAQDQLKKDGDDFMQSWEAQLKREHEQLMRNLDTVEQFGNAIQDLGDAFGSGFISTIGQAISGFAQFAKEAASATSKAQLFAVAIETIASAYSGGYQSKSPGKGALTGAAKGAATGAVIGSIVPGVGTVAGGVIGGVAGGIAGFIGGKKGQAAELAELRAQFEALMAQARQAGTVLDHVFNPRNAREYKAAIDEVKRALDTQAEAQQKLQEAVERYGFTVEELGPTMAKQRLDEQMAQIYQDWQLLTAAGVDHQAMLERIGPSVGNLIDQYKGAGVEIPAAMKPIIDDLYAHGKLLHENGEAYTQAEYDGISYAQTMSQMFQDLITKINDLVDAIRGVPKDINIKGHYTPPPNLPGGGGGGGGGEEGEEEPGGGRGRTQHALGFEGWVLPRAGGVPVNLAEAGRPEYVRISSNGPETDRGAVAGPQHIVIPVSIGGQQLDEIIMRRVRGGYIRVA
jgi:hypothetical protein